MIKVKQLLPRIPRPECADPQSLPVCFNGYGTVPVSAVDLRLKMLEPPQNVRMGKTKDVIETAAYNGKPGIDFFQKRRCAGAKTAVVRHEEHITVEVTG